MIHYFLIAFVAFVIGHSFGYSNGMHKATEALNAQFGLIN